MTRFVSKRLNTALALAGVILLVGTVTEAPEPPVSPPCDTLCLEVVDVTTGAPVDTFVVLLTRESDDPFRSHFSIPFGFPEPPPGEVIESFLVESSRGFHRFESLPASDVTIAVGSRRHALTIIRQRPADRRTIRVALVRAPALEAVVVDSAGRPVQSAEVRIMRRGEPPPAGSPRAVTDEKGSFSLQPLQLGAGVEEFALHVRHPSFPDARRIVSRSELSTRLEIVLGDRIAGGPMEGQITSKTGGSFSHVAVEAQCGRKSDVAEPAVDGSFRFPFLPYGPCLLRVLVLPGDRLIYSPDQWERIAAVSESSILHDGSMQPAALPRFARVSIEMQASSEAGTCEVIAVGPAGRKGFEIAPGRVIQASLVEGRWSIEATCRASKTILRARGQSVDVEDGVEQTVSLALLDPFPLSVRLNGEPAHSLDLTPQDPSTSTRFSSRSDRTDRTVAGLEAGTYELVVNERFVGAVDVPSPITAAIEIHTLKVLVESTDPEPTSPRLELVLLEPAGLFTYKRAPVLFHRGGAEWTSDQLLPGRYRLEVSAPGARTVKEEITLPATSTVEVKLEPHPLPFAAPEAGLPRVERMMLEAVLHDVHQRVTTTLDRDGVSETVYMISLTDTPGGPDPRNWESPDATLSIADALEAFDLDAHPSSFRIDALAESVGFVPVGFETLPVERSRLGHVQSVMELVDGSRYHDGVLLATSRPYFDRNRGRSALIIVTSLQHDFFNWLYLVEHDGAGQIVIRSVAEPTPGC